MMTKSFVSMSVGGPRIDSTCFFDMPSATSSTFAFVMRRPEQDIPTTSRSTSRKRDNVRKIDKFSCCIVGLQDVMRRNGSQAASLTRRTSFQLVDLQKYKYRRPGRPSAESAKMADFRSRAFALEVRHVSYVHRFRRSFICRIRP